MHVNSCLDNNTISRKGTPEDFPKKVLTPPKSLGISFYLMTDLYVFNNHNITKNMPYETTYF